MMLWQRNATVSVALARAATWSRDARFYNATTRHMVVCRLSWRRYVTAEYVAEMLT